MEKYVVYLLCQCTVAFIEKNDRCPYDECRESVSKTSKEMQLYYAILESMFGEEECDEDSNDVMDSERGQFKYVTIATISREHTEIVIKYDENFTVVDLKDQLYSKFGEEPARQKLSYGDTAVASVLNNNNYTFPDAAIESTFPSRNPRSHSATKTESPREGLAAVPPQGQGQVLFLQTQSQPQVLSLRGMERRIGSLVPHREPARKGPGGRG